MVIEQKTSPPTFTVWLDRLGPLVPLAALVAALPYTFIYLLNLWSLPHYQFYPLLLIAVAVLAGQRWGNAFGGAWPFRLLRVSLLLTGVGGTFCATIFASPWMGFFGFVFSLAAWLAYRSDAETGGSLLYLALPVLLIWQPPYNTVLTADTILIQSLQSTSARLSSQWLDILGYPHHQPGTVLEFAGRSFGVAEACSGIQSFFSVLCFGALLIAYLRRPPLLAIMLLATCPCWALLMNTIRITAIPIAHSLLGIDLSHGFLHDLLGYCTMGLAIGLMLSTDELLLKISQLLPAWLLTGGKPTSQRPLPFEASPSAADTEQLSSQKGRIPGRPATVWSTLAMVPALLLFAFCFAIQTYDVSESWGHQRHVIDFFRDEPLIEMTASDAPSEIAGWQQTRYAQETRGHGNDDLGERSDMWYYNTPFGIATVSFDQMFPAWHELTRCYRNAGWSPDRRTVVPAEEADAWPMVIVEMSRSNEHGYLVFSLVNRSGTVLQPPGEYSYWTILEERLRGRLTPAVRGALFGQPAYQLQTFVASHVPLSDAARSSVVERFTQLRQSLWQTAKGRLPQ